VRSTGACAVKQVNKRTVVQTLQSGVDMTDRPREESVVVGPADGDPQEM